MNILVAINKNYLEQLITLIHSIQISNPEDKFTIYILHKNLNTQDIQTIQSNIDTSKITINPILIQQSEIDNFPVYEKRYPVEIYFRIFAPKYLPKNLDRVLYLDTDIVVINQLKELYDHDFEGNYFLASTHVKKVLHKFHEIRLGLEKNHPYINTGVLLMNLKELRKLPIEEQVIQFVNKKRKILMLPDQDIISTLYGHKIKLIDDLKYNLGERAWKNYNLNNITNQIDLNWIKKNTIIIHYYGRNKPWNKNYIGKLNYFYNQISTTRASTTNITSND